MKVSLAVQVFSHSVGAALMAATMNREVGLNNTDLEIAGATSDFCSRINRIFDCLNARTSADSNPYRRGLSSKSTIVEDELKKSLAWLKLIYDPTKLKAEGVSYLLTSRLDQDKLENFFGFVRERCGYNNNPTLTQCVKNIQYAVLVTVLMPAVGGNCEADDARLLISNFNKYTVDETGDLTDKIDEKVAEWFSNNEEYWVKLNSEDEIADTSENTTGTLNDSHTTTASPTVQTSDTIDTHTDPNNTTSEIETYTLAPAPISCERLEELSHMVVDLFKCETRELYYERSYSYEDLLEESKERTHATGLLQLYYSKYRDLTKDSGIQLIDVPRAQPRKTSNNNHKPEKIQIDLSVFNDPDAWIDEDNIIELWIKSYLYRIQNILKTQKGLDYLETFHILKVSYFAVKLVDFDFKLMYAFFDKNFNINFHWPRVAHLIILVAKDKNKKQFEKALKNGIKPVVDNYMDITTTLVINNQVSDDEHKSV
ncbi:hypothetical protein TKK_0009472 [Trichogramma kaykai]